MKKRFLLLPLVAGILTACSASSPAPVVSANDSTELTPSVVTPVAQSGSAEAGWQSSNVEPTQMPSTMGTAPAPTSPAATVDDGSFPEPIRQTTTKTVTRTKTVAKQANQNFEIPRDANNAPVYSQIQKGFYDGSTYTVRKGDTMFLVAYIVGKDVKEIAALNGLKEPYNLSVGQKLKTGKPGTETVTVQETVEIPTEQVAYRQGANGTTFSSEGNVTGPVKAGTGAASAPISSGVKASAGEVTTTPTSGVVASAGTAPAVQATSPTTQTASAPNSTFKWQWPATGRVVRGFSSAEGGNKGIDIAGSKGQDVRAAAAGKVVYAGNALEGYGNLIIIKHDDDFLSAYAHNDSIKVEEQDTVKAGERIATMGSTGTSSNKLHFEIRYKGKSVDPTRYLPKK